jgi:FkbH-like protein
VTTSTTRWALLSNTTVIPVARRLEACLAERYGGGTVYVAQYGEATQQILEPTSALHAFHADIFVLFVDPDQLRPGFDLELPFLEPDERQRTLEALRGEVLMLVRAIRSHSTAPILVNNFPVVPRTSLGLGLDRIRKDAIRRSNLDLAELVAAEPGCHLYDYDGLWSEVGWNDRDVRFELLAQLPFGPRLQERLVDEWIRFFMAFRGEARKCVVVDLDNTLWGGILGEDGPDGIQMADTPHGRPYRRLQLALQALIKRGVVVAVCSKNNLDDVLPVLREHPDMVLREADFVAMRINWQDKASNLREIASELNLGLQHFVFLDDNPTEREWVRQSLPEVLVPELPEDASLFALALNDCELDTLTLTAEDRKRSAMYAEERQRRDFEAATPDFDEFLRQLDLSVRIESVSTPLLERAAQLCQRTNQFNLTTRRHTAADLERFAAAADRTVLMMNVRDRFGEYGWTGLAIGVRNGDVAEIDSFLVSCRVLGKRVEQALFTELASWARNAGCVELLADFLPTRKNALCADFYSQCGMTEVPERPGRYRARLADLPELGLAHIHRNTSNGNRNDG